MKKEFRYILQPLEVLLHEKFGSYIRLQDHEHFDYIDDVLTEIFEIEHTFHTEGNGEYVVYFEQSTSHKELCKVVQQINRHHEVSKQEYSLPSGT